MGIRNENKNETFICASTEPEGIVTVSISRSIRFASFAEFLLLGLFGGL